MPIETILLRGEPYSLVSCPRCKRRFVPFMRGQVQRGRRWLWGIGPKRAYCAVICSRCKEIVDWESPPKDKIKSVLQGKSLKRGGDNASV